MCIHLSDEIKNYILYYLWARHLLTTKPGTCPTDLIKGPTINGTISLSFPSAHKMLNLKDSKSMNTDNCFKYWHYWQKPGARYFTRNETKSIKVFDDKTNFMKHTAGENMLVMYLFGLSASSEATHVATKISWIFSSIALLNNWRIELISKKKYV